MSNLSFHTGHGDLAHGDWIGLLAQIAAGKGGLDGVTFRFVRHNERNESFLCDLDQEGEALAAMLASSKSAKLTPRATRSTWTSRLNPSTHAETGRRDDARAETAFDDDAENNKYKDRDLNNLQPPLAITLDIGPLGEPQRSAFDHRLIGPRVTSSLGTVPQFGAIIS